MTTKSHHQSAVRGHDSASEHHCASVPEFERLNYFYGQMLGAADFRGEQAYFREKLKLHNRCLHGYGVVCGLQVTPVEAESCCPSETEETVIKLRRRLKQLRGEIREIKTRLEQEDLEAEERQELEQALESRQADLEEARRALESLGEKVGEKAEEGAESDEAGEKDCVERPKAPVVVHCGLALDCHGNELVLREALTIDLWSALAPSEQHRLQECGEGTIYLSICYCAEPIHPSRPVLADHCGSLSDCNYARYRDSLRFRVSIETPDQDGRCEPCCTPCTDECVLLAAIRWDDETPILADDINNGVRRAIGLYEPTVISGISWNHAKTCSPDEAKTVFGTETSGGRSDGIEVHFSRPVHADTLTRGVVDLWRIQGGSGLRGVISSMEGDFVDKPDSGLIDHFKYRDESGETLNNGDRILIIIRCDFILDECCRPVDGNHIGGRVPRLSGGEDPEAGEKVSDKDLRRGDEYQQKPSEEDQPPPAVPCSLPAGGIGPWTSGNGSAGGTFESWIYIK